MRIEPVGAVIDRSAEARVAAVASRDWLRGAGHLVLCVLGGRTCRAALPQDAGTGESGRSSREKAPTGDARHVLEFGITKSWFQVEGIRFQQRHNDDGDGKAAPVEGK